jgi:hypothetical protein
MKSMHFYNIIDDNTIEDGGEGSLIPDYADFEDFAINGLKATKVAENKYKLPDSNRYISLEESSFYNRDITCYHQDRAGFISDYIKEKYKEEFNEIKNKKHIDSGSFEIWIEGYQGNGDSACPQCIGIGYGKTFKSACKELANRDENFKKYFNASSMTYWGCKLYEG